MDFFLSYPWLQSDVFDSIVCITEYIRLLYLYLLFPGTEGIVTSCIQMDWRATNYEGVSGQKNEKIQSTEACKEGTKVYDNH